MPAPFPSSTDSFTDAFHTRLQDLLRLPAGEDALGLLILVLANASMMPEMADALGPAIRKRYRELQAAGAPALESAPADDAAVFRQLQAFDLEQIPLVRERETGPWRLQFNPLRALRPARNSSAVIDRLYRPFDAQGFHFDKPFLEREMLWRGSVGGRDLRLLFNKFPFARYHCLALIDAAAHKPQHLARRDVSDLLHVMDALQHLEGLAFAWNSLGAFASVNHQHWQMTLSDRAYPVEAPRWRHRGGDNPYPLTVQRIQSEEALWRAIDACQRQDQAFNLLLRPGDYCLIRRRRQGHFEAQGWAPGLAWSEVCGSFGLSDEALFNGLEAEAITQQLRALATD